MNERMKELGPNRTALEVQVLKQKKFDEEAKQIREKEERRTQSEKETFLDNLIKEISGEYKMSYEQAQILVDQAWKDGHPYGYHEVRNYAEEYAEWVEKIIKLQKKMDN